MAAPPSPAAPGALNWLLITVLSVVWGAAFLATARALEGFGPWTVAAGRTLIGGAALLAVGLALGQGPDKIPGRRGWAFVVALGLLSTAMPFTLLSFGLRHVPSAFAGVAMGSVPLLVLPLVALFSPDEGIGPRRVLGILLGFAGLLALIGPDAFGPGQSPHGLAGQLACMGAAGCYAMGSVATRRAPAMPAPSLGAGLLLVASAILVPIALWREGWPTAWPPGPTAALLLLGIVPTAMAAVLRIRVVTTAGALFMSLTSYLVPLWAVLFGIVLGGETLPANLYAALGLILAGIAVAQSRALLAAFRA